MRARYEEKHLKLCTCSVSEGNQRREVGCKKCVEAERWEGGRIGEWGLLIYSRGNRDQRSVRGDDERAMMTVRVRKL